MYYLAWTISIGLIIYWGMKYQVQLNEEAKMKFELFPVVRFATLFPIVIGLLLRLPKLIIEIYNKKQWTFDWVKFIAIGLPCFYVLTMSLLPYSPLGQGSIPIPDIIITGSPTVTTVAGIVFGFVLLDSLKK
ncbi:hypothetical protein [Virgibacillus sp. L01]|uniref:hypothetical protein n=1 Tax=Virgibacillus sp. L01 TaxID=3457429 RepID=UPI003FCFA008